MTRTASIRKAAILVSLLDSRSADALLEPMEEELAAGVRQAVMELHDVSAQEQEQVLAEFFGRGELVDPVDDGVEMELSGDGPLSPAMASTAGSPSLPRGMPAPSFAFLVEVEPALLAEVLAGEHPQTMAAVVAFLPHAHAGQVLQRLGPSLATEALARMARLTMPAPEVLADLESELRRRLAACGHDSTGGAESIANVQAILASLPGQSRLQLIDRLARHDQHLARKLDGSAERSHSADAAPTKILSLRYRLESSPPPHLSRDRGDAAVSPPLMEFEDLTLLSERDLACWAAAANLQMLALALIDADERLTRRILTVLPARSAADLRSRLVQPGPLRLKEIDQAQRELAELARHLAGRGEITLPHSRHFAAAA